MQEVYYRRGLIPGPRETETAFLSRVDRVQKEIFSRDPKIAKADWDFARDKTFSLYGIEPDWITAQISCNELSFWEAGAAWTLESGQVSIHLQEQNSLASHAEVLAHETVHAVRSAFHEDRFEEILAYKTSEKKWRRYWGPLIRRPWEVKCFFASVLVDMICMVISGVCFFTPFILALLSVRLIQDQRTLSRCLTRLPNKKMILCFTDKEIMDIARGVDFARLDDGSFRWQMINTIR